jgi:hypothetical protein
MIERHRAGAAAAGLALILSAVPPAAALAQGGAPVRPRLVYLFFADGTTALPAGETCGGQSIPTAHRCDLFPATSPQACRAAIVAQLQVWYAGLPVAFTTARPERAHDTIVITSDSRWCSVPRGISGDAPEACEARASGIAYVYECVFSVERCAALIAHEHGHLLGLQHVEGATDIMAEGGCSSCAGFLDRELPVVAPQTCGRATQSSRRRLQARLAPVLATGRGCAVGGAAEAVPAPPLFLVSMLLTRRRRKR